MVGTDESMIYYNIKLLLENEKEYNKMSIAKNPYGDGHASEYIIQAIENYFKKDIDRI